jgi:uncharacterized protein YcbX
MGVLQENRVIVAVTGVSVAAFGIFAFNHFLRQYRYWNSEFKEVGNVKELFLYPIKSGKSMNIEWMDCKKNGAKYNENGDRHFLVVDEKANHLFLTARQYPKLVLIDSKVIDDILIMTVPNGDTVKINLKEVKSRQDIRNGILHFKKTQEGFDCGDEAAEFLENFLETKNKRKLRLLYFNSDLKTERNYTSKSEFWKNPVPILPDYPAYQDLASFMTTTEASVDELNSRLEKLESNVKCKVSARNFRPNISIEGTKPFDEDWWLDVKIGEAEFACFKPCTRCIMTTVNPDTGKFDKNMQPFRLLKSYRLTPKGKLRDLYQDSPIFGVNMIIKKEGRIKVGDKVFVRYKPSPF